mgnify:CR=1 FL=1
MMEPIIVIVGFLGAGKTTLLKKLLREFMDKKSDPCVILNDYENAFMDSQQLLEFLTPKQVNALSGSCICCSGVAELRNQVNSIKKRERGVTLIEANGTSDACALLGFLGVGLKEHFLPPVQISVVDVRSWQERGFDNELEANQIQVSSLIILNHHESVGHERIEKVKSDILYLNPSAQVILWNDLQVEKLLSLKPSENKAQKMDHLKAHWSSCSVDLPDPISSQSVKEIIKNIPESILRVKGCTRFDDDSHYTYFERVPSGDVSIRPYHGDLITGPKILVIGPGSDPDKIERIIQDSAQSLG